MASITIYSDVIIPNSIVNAGVRGKQMRRNARASAGDGRMKINAQWSNTLRQYELGTVPLTVAQWQTLEGLHEVTEGGTYGCLMQDPKDCSASITTGKATLISAGAHTYQLIKQYTSIGSSRTKNRTIRRLKASTFILYLSGVASGSYTLDAQTGIITIPSDPSASNVTWSGIFYVPVHFANDDIDWDLTVAGGADSRLMTGPSLLLDEVRE
jgi:uncharacterized protein (TIGR02217 family)